MTAEKVIYEPECSICIRQAELDDFDSIWQIILEAKAMMAASGRTQWNEAYPSPEIIQKDIAGGCARVLLSERKIVGYAVVVFNGEPAYDHLKNGQWLSDGAYYVVHRLAVAEKCRGTGIARFFFQYLEDVCRRKKIGSIRVDTNYDNSPMIAALQKAGFVHCGIVTYAVNGDREVYEKVIDEDF